MLVVAFPVSPLNGRFISSTKMSTWSLSLICNIRSCDTAALTGDAVEVKYPRRMKEEREEVGGRKDAYGSKDDLEQGAIR
jgi:hypothetical protein